MATRPKSVIESHDGEKLSPITITKNVLTDNGQNLHDILSDRKEDMMTPTIENSSSMFKVGQGDNVDYSGNVVNGAYESCVLKGKSLVNLLTKTLDTTWNLNLENWSIVSTVPSDYVLKPSTTYSVIVYVTEKTCPDREDLFWVGDVDGKKDKVTHDIVRKNVSLGANVFVINTVSDFSSVTSEYRGGINFQGSKFVEGTLKWKAIVLEGDWTNKELPPYFEGLCDCKSPILSNVGKNLFDVDGEFVKGAYSFGIPLLSSSNQVIEKVGENSLHITCGTNFYHSGWGQIIDVKNLDSVTISVTPTFSNSLTNPELKVLCLYESEEIPTTMDAQKKTYYDNRHLTQTLNDTNKTYTRTINTRGFAKVYVLFTGGYKANGQGTFDFTLHNIYIGEESTYHGYESYKLNTTTFDQKDGKTIVLRSLPNGICDTLNVETGEYIQRIGELTFNGSKAEWRVMPYPPQEDGTHYQFQYWLGDNLIGGDLWNNSNAILADTLPTADGTLHWGGKSRYGIGGDRSNFMITWEKSSCPFYDVPTLNAWLGQNPITVQYQLATPVVKTVDVQGFPYAYTNGHVILSSGSTEQSLTPKVEYSVVTNRNGQIRSNQKMVERQQKQLDYLQAMVLANLVNTQYEQTLTNLKYDLKNVREEVK